MGSWGDTMLDSVTVARITARDAYGAETYGAQSVVACRYEPDAVAVRNGDGEVVDYQDLIITETAIDSADTVRGGWTEAMVWPPGADTSSLADALKPVRAKRTNDLSGGDTLYEVAL